MNKIKTYALFFTLALMVKNNSAQEAKATAFSLQQAIDYAMKNSPNIVNAELDRQNSEYKKNEIRGLGLPQVTASIDLKDYLAIPTSLLPAQIFGGTAGTYLPVKFGTKYNSTAGINVSQLLFNADYIFGLKASREFIGLSQINLTRTKSELAVQVSKAYYMVLVNNEKIKALDANILRLKKNVDDLTAYNKEGFIEQIDLESMQVVSNNLSNEKSKVEKLIVLAKTALKFQMGLKLSDEIELTDALSTDEQIAELSSSNINIKPRAEIQLLNAQQVLFDLDVKRLKYGYIPTLVGYGAFQYNAQRSTFNFLQFDKNDITKKWFPVSLIGITLNANLFDGLQRHYKIQQAKIASQKNINSMKNVEMAFELEANSAVVNYNNAIVSMNIQKKNMDLAQHIVDVNNKKYKEGIGANIAIVNAETMLKEAQANYYNAIFDLLTAKVDYQKATGTLVK